MIKLTDETKLNKDGEVVDNSLYLIRENENNLALVRGTRTIAHFGDVRTALTRALNYAVKGSTEELTLDFITRAVFGMDEVIRGLDPKDCK